MRTNEAVTDLVKLGVALLQTIDGQGREHQLRCVDWSDWRANAFHMTAEFPIEWPGGAVIGPYIVLFVNGTPFAVIEAKRNQEDALQPPHLALANLTRSRS